MWVVLKYSLALGESSESGETGDFSSRSPVETFCWRQWQGSPECRQINSRQAASVRNKCTPITYGNVILLTQQIYKTMHIVSIFLSNIFVRVKVRHPFVNWVDCNSNILLCFSYSRVRKWEFSVHFNERMFFWTMTNFQKTMNQWSVVEEEAISWNDEISRIISIVLSRNSSHDER